MAQITDAFTVQPDCGGAGTATFTLPAGIYTVTATCSGTSVDYEVTIDRECVFLEVDLQNPDVSDDYLPLTLGASWSYNDLIGTAAEQTIISEQEGVPIDERQYTKLTSDNGAEYYYRKNGHEYYQYLTMDFQGTVASPPSLEVKILQDDLAEGAQWESPVEDLLMAGINVKGKLVFTISKKGFSENINGVDYSDLIEVTAELYLSPDGVTNFVGSGSQFKRAFARGIGIVRYDDLSQATTWGITTVVLNP
jgi:hypothetical protein